MPSPPVRRRAALAAGLLALAALGGCAPAPSPTPSPTQAQDPLVVYRRIADQVATIRQLDASKRVDPRIIDRDQLKKNIAAEYAKSNPPAQVKLSERVLIALGLLPPGSSLADLVNDLNGSQVIGYYDPSVKELFIVSQSGSLGPTERLTYAHEFTHELQDDHFDLGSLGLDKSFDEGDRGLAVLGLVEGDAVSAQTTWMAGNLSAAELGQVALAAADPAILEVLGRTPKILLETSLFPYQQGATFVEALMAQGGYARVDQAYKDPPASTEQVLHPDRYLTHEAPVDVQLPDDLAARLGTGWTLDAQDTLGELQLRVWLREGGVPGDVARLAADGWGGDRLGLFHGPGGRDLVILLSEWDTESDAFAFRNAAVDAGAGLKLDLTTAIGRMPNGGTRVAVAIGSPSPSGLDAILVDLVGDVLPEA